MTCHARKKNTGIEAHPAHVFPTAERLRRQCPLSSRGDGLFSEQGHGIVVGVSCTKLLPPNPSWRSGRAHELGGAPAEKLNGMLSIKQPYYHLRPSRVPHSDRPYRRSSFALQLNPVFRELDLVT